MMIISDHGPRYSALLPAALGILALGSCAASAAAIGPPAPSGPALSPADRTPPIAGPDTFRIQPDFREEMENLASRPAVRAALDAVRASSDRTLSDQIALTEIPAPPFAEERRGRAFAEMLRELGADSVFTDQEGNVIGVRQGEEGSEILVVSGHLDTVFPEGTDVTVRHRGDTLYAPGIGDDARGLATVLTLFRVLQEAEIATRGDIWFVGTVGEEGLGDLRGVKHLFREDGPPIDTFISVDGSSAERVVNRGLGSRRYRVTFEGPGGHSWGAFGLANPAHALGRAIQRFQGAAGEFTTEGPRTSYNVGRVGGGTSVNSIPFEAWMEVDMRSVEQERLLRIDSLFREEVRRSLGEANAARRDGPELTVDMELVGDRPSGEVDPHHPLVQQAGASAAHLGYEPSLERSSTDANTPIAAGIPAVTIGGGGEGGGAHSLDEWWRDPGDAYRGIQRALLLVLSQAGLAE